MFESVRRDDRQFRRELVHRWAPIHYQDVHQSRFREDYISKIDFDGNWKTKGNWDSMENFPLPPAVYLSLVETHTHWFIIYGFYHPRDWSDIPFDGQHENDFEGYLTIIQKPTGVLKEYYPYGIHVGLISIAHWDFYSYSNVLSGNRESVDGRIFYTDWSGICRPSSFQESKGHGCYAWDGEEFPSGAGIRYYPSDATADPEEPGEPYYGSIGEVDAPYVLINIFEPDGLWARKFLPVDEPFASNGSFAGTKHGVNKANPPWKWDDKNDGSDLAAGVIAYDPAYLVWQYFSGHTQFSFEYVHNLYVGEADSNGSRKKVERSSSRLSQGKSRKPYSMLLCDFSEERISHKELNKMMKSSDRDNRYVAALQLIGEGKAEITDYLLMECLNYSRSWETITTLSIQAKKSRKFHKALSERISHVFKNYGKLSGVASDKILKVFSDSHKLAPLVYLAGEIQDRSLYDYIIEVFKGRKDKLLQYIAADALSKFKTDKIREIEPIVRRELRSPHHGVKEASIKILHRWFMRNDAQFVTQLVSDDHPNIRKGACYLLEGIKSTDSVEVLKSLIDDPEWDVKFAATKVLISNLGKEGLNVIKEKFEQEYQYASAMLDPGRVDITKEFSDCPMSKQEYGKLQLIALIADSLSMFR